MAAVRKKRKPDAYVLNFVKSSGRRSRVKITKRKVPCCPNSLSVHSKTKIQCQVQDEESAWDPDQDDGDWEDEGSDGFQEDSRKKSHRDHYTRESNLSNAWGKQREAFNITAIENYSMPSVFCVTCEKEDACVICEDCGPNVYYCADCGTNCHSSWFVHHSPKLWDIERRIFVPLVVHRIIKLANHSCDTSYQRNIVCVNVFGVQHKVMFQFCDCYSEAKLLMKMKLFPGTPEKPTIAFSFHLLDYLESLLLECQVSVSDFVAAITFLSDDVFTNKRRPLYPLIINCFEEYRYLKYKLRSLNILCHGKDKGVICPACPSSVSDRIYSMDALFGLCRKKSAGISVRSPLQEGVFFERQPDVDKFVELYPYRSDSSADQECSDFLATDALRSKSRFKSLDETGIMGLCCRHEFPFRFYNLRHGERISYAVYGAQIIQKQLSVSTTRFKLLYDVACLLRKHLKRTGQTDLNNSVELAVPAFHVYGHNFDCQIKYSPRYNKGFGLTDGEVLERLWSYLRRYSRMTKEMRPSHRVDILTDALLHYAKKSRKNLKNLLPLRLKRAKSVKLDAEKRLIELRTTSCQQFNEENVLEWLKREQESESLHFGPTSDGNIAEQCLAKVFKSARERWYLLSLKGKYAEGQYLASRISKSITKETKKLKELIRTYNSCIEKDKMIQWKEVTDLSSEIWSQVSPMVCHASTTDSLPRSTKLTVIKWMMMKIRAAEEISLITDEMKNVIGYFQNQIFVIKSAIEKVGESRSLSVSYQLGAVCLLSHALYEMESEYSQCCKSFQSYIETPQPFSTLACLETFSSEEDNNSAINDTIENEDSILDDNNFAYQDQSESDSESSASEDVEKQNQLETATDKGVLK